MLQEKCKVKLVIKALKIDRRSYNSYPCRKPLGTYVYSALLMKLKGEPWKGSMRDPSLLA